MHNHALRPASIEARVIEVKGLCVVNHKFDGQPLRRGATPGLEYHALADVDANRMSLTTGDRKRAVAKPASKIEDPFPAGQLQSGKNNGLAGNDIR
jgi:hypothetical protein